MQMFLEMTASYLPKPFRQTTKVFYKHILLYFKIMLFNFTQITIHCFKNMNRPLHLIIFH